MSSWLGMGQSREDFCSYLAQGTVKFNPASAAGLRPSSRTGSSISFGSGRSLTVAALLQPGDLSRITSRSLMSAVALKKDNLTQLNSQRMNRSTYPTSQ